MTIYTTIYLALDNQYCTYASEPTPKKMSQGVTRIFVKTKYKQTDKQTNKQKKTKTQQNHDYILWGALWRWRLMSD